MGSNKLRGPPFYAHYPDDVSRAEEIAYRACVQSHDHCSASATITTLKWSLARVVLVYPSPL